ncbi:hypothetical protein JZU54_08830, partial [bacterium]|nr:hypothetical protein [bacterium]
MSELNPAFPATSWSGISFFDNANEKLFMGKPNSQGFWGFQLGGQMALSTMSAATPVMMLLKI